jgi:hypothetical protein
MVGPLQNLFFFCEMGGREGGREREREKEGMREIERESEKAATEREALTRKNET